MVSRAKKMISEVVEPGDVAIDATTGNGYDAVFLARLVRAGGHVYGFDSQEAAIRSTRDRLKTEGLLDNVHLLHGGHETMRNAVPEQLHGAIAAVMFNLGYLPGSDKQLITTAQTTIPALEQATDLLRPGGRVTVVQYVGHEGGTEEAAAVDAWAASLESGAFSVLQCRILNASGDPPRLLSIDKRNR